MDPVCRGCLKPLLKENAWMFDGCPCNSNNGCNDNIQEISQWRKEDADALRIKLELLSKDLKELEHKFEYQRSRVQDAHQTFHELVKDSPAPFNMHTPEGDNNPSAQMKIIASERDFYRNLIHASQSTVITVDNLGQHLDKFYSTPRPPRTQ